MFLFLAAFLSSHNFHDRTAGIGALPAPAVCVSLQWVHALCGVLRAIPVRGEPHESHRQLASQVLIFHVHILFYFPKFSVPYLSEN